MNGTELFKKDGSETGVFFCQQCRLVHRDKPHADLCCAPRLCECGASMDKYRTKCESCWDLEQRNHEAKRFASAAHLADWDGPVYRAGCGGNEGFHASLSDFWDWANDQDATESTPSYVWTCDKEPVVKLDVRHVLENATDGAYEDFSYDDLTGIDELKAAMDRFNETNKDVVSWVPNYTRAVVFGLKPNICT